MRLVLHVPVSGTPISLPIPHALRKNVRIALCRIDTTRGAARYTSTSGRKRRMRHASASNRSGLRVPTVYRS